MTLYEDRDCWLGYSNVDGFITLHTLIESWSPSKYKKYINVLASCLEGLDTDIVYSVAKNKKAKRFNELFGFTETGRTKENYYIMRLYVRS